MVGLPDFRSHLKSGLFANQKMFDHLKSRLVQISDLPLYVFKFTWSSFFVWMFFGGKSQSDAGQNVSEISLHLCTSGHGQEPDSQVCIVPVILALKKIVYVRYFLSGANPMKNFTPQNKLTNILLTDWYARKNVDDTIIFVTIFITGTNQVRSITDSIYCKLPNCKVHKGLFAQVDLFSFEADLIIGFSDFEYNHGCLFL